MIVVIGDVSATGSVGEPRPAGLAAAVAHGAAADGGQVELVSRIGDDPVGDALLLAIAAEGIGHVATLRDAAHATPLEAETAEPLDPAADRGGRQRGWARTGSVRSSMARMSRWRSATCRSTASSSWRTRARPSWRRLGGPPHGRAPTWSSWHDRPTPPMAPPTCRPTLWSWSPTGRPTGVAATVGRYAAAVDAGTAPAAAFDIAFAGLDGI